ncbi:MAG: diguanylate cyclase [Burkholderiales bacterium]
MTALERQLAVYAEDFQELVGRLHDLESRYLKLKEAHTQLAEARGLLGNLNPSSQELCLVLGRRGEIVDATENAQAMFALDSGQVTNIQQIVSPLQLPHLQSQLEAMERDHAVPLAEPMDILLYPKGDSQQGRLFSTNFFSLQLAGTARMLLILRDLSGDAGAEVDAEHMVALVKSLHHGAMVTDVAGRVLAVDTAFSKVTGYRSAALCGTLPTMLRIVGEGDYLQTPAFWEQLRHTEAWRGEVVNTTQGGQTVHQWMSITALKDFASNTVAYLAVLINREVILNAEHAMLEAFYHDPLTGLPNMDLFRERVNLRMQTAREDGTTLMLMSIKLNSQQWIHDSNAQSVSETVYKTLSERLQEEIRGCDEIARTGYDRYVVLLCGARAQEELPAIAARMLSALAAPIRVRRQTLVVGGSIGCAQFPLDGADLFTLLHHADMAMGMARKLGGNRYCLYRSASDVAAETPLPEPVQWSADEMVTVHQSLS